MAHFLSGVRIGCPAAAVTAIDTWIRRPLTFDHYLLHDCRGSGSDARSWQGVTSSASRKCRCSDFLQSTSLWAVYDGAVVTDRYEAPAV